MVTYQSIYTVKSYCEFMNKFIEVIQWNVLVMIPFAAIAASFVNLQWIVLGNQLLTVTNIMNIITIL